MRAHPFLLLVLALTACTDLPDVEGSISPEAQAAPPPQLIPLGPLLADLPPPGETRLSDGMTQPEVEATQTMEARQQALRARAAALREASL